MKRARSLKEIEILEMEMDKKKYTKYKTNWEK